MKMLLALAVSALTFSAANAATIEIKMKNSGADGIMAFDPPYVEAKKGDTIKFTPTDVAHDAASVSIPKGAKAWSGQPGKAVTTKVTEEGVYFYECKSHVAMTMVGIIQVGGKSTNAEEAKKAADAMAPQFAMNKERVEKYFAQVKK